MQDKDCVFGRRQHADIGRNREAVIDPGLEAAGKRSNIFKSSLPQCQGNACAGGFAREKRSKG